MDRYGAARRGPAVATDLRPTYWLALRSLSDPWLQPTHRIRHALRTLRLSSSRSAGLSLLWRPPCAFARCTHPLTTFSVRRRSLLTSEMLLLLDRTRPTTSALNSALNRRRSQRPIWTSSAGFVPTSWWSVTPRQAHPDTCSGLTRGLPSGKIANAYPLRSARRHP